MIDFFKNHMTLKNVIFFIIAILFLVFLTKIKDIAILFFASYVIACSLNPVVDKLAGKVNRGFAAGLVLLCGMLIVILFLIPIIIMGGHQVSSFLQLLPEHFDSVKNYLASVPMLKNTEISQLDLGGILSSATGITSNVVSSSISFTKEVGTAVIYFLAGCIIIYYFMADKDVVKQGFLKMFPHQLKDRADEIINSISRKIGGYVVAQVVTMFSVGFIIFIGLAVIGVDYALLLGLLSAIFDIVPIVGPAVALIVILLTVYKSGALTIGLVLLVFAFAQWAENNLVRPYIFSKFLDLHPLIIYFFLFVTAQFLGIIGVVFAPAIAATVCVLIEELYIKSIN